MNIELRQGDVRSNSRLKIVDVDIHPKSSLDDLKPYLSQRWWDHLMSYGARAAAGLRQGVSLSRRCSRWRRAAIAGRRMADCRRAISAS